MRILSPLLYWTLSYALIWLGIPLRWPMAMLRRFLDSSSGRWEGLRNPRLWAEAVLLALAWNGLPALISLLIDDRLYAAGIAIPWMGAHAYGPAAWWFAGTGTFFGLLHRNLVAGVITGVLALGWEWLFLVSPAWMNALPAPLGSMVYGALFGLALAALDLLAGPLPGNRRRKPGVNA